MTNAGKSKAAAVFEDLGKRVLSAAPLEEIVLFGHVSLQVGTMTEDQMWDCLRIVRHVSTGVIAKDGLPLAAARIVCHLISQHHPDITPEEVKCGVTSEIFEQVAIEISRRFAVMMSVARPDVLSS